MVAVWVASMVMVAVLSEVRRRASERKQASFRTTFRPPPAPAPLPPAPLVAMVAPVVPVAPVAPSPPRSPSAAAADGGCDCNGWWLRRRRLPSVASGRAERLTLEAGMLSVDGTTPPPPPLLPPPSAPFAALAL